MNSGFITPAPIIVDWSRSAADFGDALAWLRTPPHAENADQIFARRLREEMALLCGRIEDGYRPPLDEAASIAYSRPMHQLRFRMGKTRRARDSSGMWRVYYALEDKNQDNLPDVLQVISIIHAAALPKTAWLTENTEDD